MVREIIEETVRDEGRFEEIDRQRNGEEKEEKGGSW